MKIELAHHWVWMSAMEFACDVLQRSAYYRVPGITPTQGTWENEYKNRFEYVLKNWDEIVADAISRHTARGSPDGKYCVGFSSSTRRNGVEAIYGAKNITVFIRWSEVKTFIEEMLNPDKQMSMFELLLDEALRR